MRRGTVAVLLALAVVATIEAQKSGGNEEQGTGSGEQETTESDDPVAPPRSGGFEVTNLCFTSISVASNEATLGVSWPLDFIETGSKIDLFAFTSLDAAGQTWLSAHEVAAAETNWTPTVDTSCLATGTDVYPPMLFFSASVRAAPDDLRDTDGDTLPDVYEVHNGTNPYVPDYDDASKLVVRPSGSHPTIASALAASTDYSIIELDPAFVHDVASAVHVPAHPVMVCSPPGTCAVVRATQFAAFLLNTNVTSRTLFKNIYILLDARSNFQAAFLLGGYLPDFPVTASATFENIYVRASNPGVEYFGWLLYTSAEEPVTLSRCTVNAAGSEWVYGVQDFGTAPLVLDRCSFVNFPANLTGKSCGILTRSSLSVAGGAEVSVSRTVFDESFTNAIMIGRLEEGVSNVISAADCIVPRELPPAFPLEFVSGVIVTNAALAWAGFPWPDSPSVALGVGSLSPIANDPAMDTDGDGLSDYKEIYNQGTDPFLADTDRDGIADGDEIGQGTDPSDPHSFLQNLTVSVTNTASLSHAAYVAYGNSSDTWETNGLASFQSGFGSTLYTNASEHGAAYIKAFCDLDDDGEYSPTADILLIKTIPQGAAANVSFRFGDVDGDGVNDEQELQDGTDPHDANNYAVNLSGHFEGVFHTTNMLSVTLQTTSEVLYGPVSLMNGTTWTFSSNHVEVTDGGRPYFVFWDDANSNDVREASETAVTYTLSPFSHDIAFTNRLSYGSFDRDSDGMLDWWEVQHGLCQTNKADSVEDTDGDGLINLHEFWCETDPFVPDGSNTLLSVMSRSIDNRIRDIDPAAAVPLFTDYFTNGASGNFVANTNLWTRGLDLSCASVWHDGTYPESKAATLITRKHVVLAQHWYNNGQYTFYDTNGLVCVRTLVQKKPIYGDLLLGRLDAPLPDSFRPASIMSTNFVDYLSTGRYLPTLCVNQEKCATVLELENLDVTTIDNRGNHYVHYGMNSYTNVVSSQRCAVRSVTYGGNSGCPVFLVVGDELILLFAKHLGALTEGTWSPFWGPMLSFHLEAIQGQINQWEGDDANLYQIAPFDLSPFDEVIYK